MNLFRMLNARASEGRPMRIGLIGAGKFGAMYLAQVPRTPGLHLVGIADLSPAAARVNLERVGWEPEQFGATSLTLATIGRRSSRIRASTSSLNAPAIRRRRWSTVSRHSPTASMS